MKQVNIIYHDHSGPTKLIYKSNQGEIYYSKHRINSMQNIGMNWHSNQHPKQEDGLLILEPYCVNNAADYNLEYHQKIDKIFTWSTKPLENTSSWPKVIEINHPCLHDFPNIHNLQQTWPKWNERKDEIVFIASNKSSSHFSEIYSLRLELADLLYKYSKYKVSWYGQIPVDKPYYKGQIEHKEQILNQVKFSVCTENCYDPIYSWNYFTEKMPDVWLAGCVPIYMGCYNIDQFKFSEHSYIDLRIYCKKQNEKWIIDERCLLDRIHHYNEEFYIGNIYHEMTDNILKPNGLYYQISYPRTFETILQNYNL